MPAQLAHERTCASYGLQNQPVELHFSITHHPDRSGTTLITAYERCEQCRRCLVYTADVVAVRNVLRNLRRQTMIDVSTWLHRQGLWGDQPLPGLS
jgi:NADH dehydrogenase/NADH:ubiquinone oxidoreductase subunit G